MAEDHVVEDGPGDAKTHQHVLVGVTALGAQGGHLVAAGGLGLDGGIYEG